MQKVTIICTGKLKEKFYLDAAAEYAKRLSRFCTLTILELPEERLPESPSPAQIEAALAREADAVRAKLPAGCLLIAMCEEFTRYRVQAITESVNSKFRLTRWRLFTEQVNGGLADCCEPMDMNGSTFEGTNNAMQINIGMDIIDTLSAHFGRRVPLFVDNAESVTHLQPIGSQVVRLVVSEQDKELRIE